MHNAVPIIARQAELQEHCRRWRAAGEFAFDTEFIRDDTYDAALCLLQVASDGEVALIDPTADIDCAPFWDLVRDPTVRTVVHAGKEDFDLCLRITGEPPRNVFDVQIAAGFVGLGYPLSLSRLVAAVAHKRITKGSTLTDWGRRPLTDDQMRYAVEDVAYLPLIAAELTRQLAALTRSDWAAEEFARFESPELYRPPPQERAARLKGTRNLDPLAIVTLEKLIDWRDRWAQERNRPTRAMMRDDILIEIARRRPTKPPQLEVLRGFPQARNPKIIQQILDIVAEADKTPRSALPKLAEIRDEPPMIRAAIDLLAGYLRATCDLEKLDYELVGGTQRLRDLIEHLQGFNPDRPTLLTGWRAEFAGKRLLAMLEGRCALRLAGWPDKLALLAENT